MALIIRGLVLLSVGLMACYFLRPGSMAMFALRLPDWLRGLGVALAAAAIALFYVTFAALGRHFSMSLHLKQNHHLIEIGPYALIRHPMYVAYQLLWLGLSLSMDNVLVAVCGLIAFSYVMIRRTPREEAMLEKQFGQAYRDYCQRTKKFIPGVW